MSLVEAVDAISSTPNAVAHLSLISAACLGEIAFYLNFSELSTLRLCGHSLLNAKLLKGVEKIHIEIGCLQTFPLHVFKYPRLRRLRVVPHYHHVATKASVPYWIPEPGFIPIEGHQMLEKLTLNGPACFTVLQPSHWPYALHKLLPNLKGLKILSAGHFNIKYFRNLPPNLATLNLTFLGRRIPFPSSAIALLPRSLVSLKLENLGMHIVSTPVEDDKDQDEDHFVFSGDVDKVCLSFPPNLTTLKIDSTYLDAMLPHVPNTVEKLMIGIFRPTALNKVAQTFRISAVPKKNLTDLQIGVRDYGDEIDIIADQPFPSTLHTLVLPFEIKNADDLDLNVLLPRSLTTFSGCDDAQHTLDWTRTVPLLRICTPDKSLFRRDDIPTTWPPVVSMYLPKDLDNEEVIRSLPDSIMFFRAPVSNIPVWLEKISRLKYLEVLELSGTSTPMPEHYWQCLYDRLTYISADIGHCESLKHVFTTKWTRMRLFYFTATTYSQVHSAVESELELLSPYVPDESQKLYLPTMLQDGSITITTPYEALIKPFCEVEGLSTLSITIRGEDAEVQTENNAVFEPLLHLPASLTNFSFDIPSYMHPKYLRSLPPKIRTLSLSHGYKVTSKYVWTPDDIKLPPSLTCLYNQVVEITQSLPPTLISNDGTGRNRIKTSASQLLARQLMEKAIVDYE